ncbi:alpha/beta fold hydrolase [Mycobacterium sp. SMC-17]|uniref:alpha/beta fold hydrolase n=1 Tax=Mycobacterium sp. SMC-17 TaxID=3381628 RepID=UPI003876B850
MTAMLAAAGAGTAADDMLTASYTITTADGVRLAVREHCPANVTANILLSHGFCLSQNEWAYQVEYLIEHFGDGVRIMTYDHRGHGESDTAPVHTYTVHQLAQDLATVTAELHVEGPLVLAGHSMGAMTILEFLKLSRWSRPVDPAGLVLVATAAGRLCEHGLGRVLASPLSNALTYLAAHDHLVAHAPEILLRTVAGPICTAAGLYAHCGRDERATLNALTASAFARTPLSTAAGFLRGLARYDATDVLATITAPTVIVSGDADLLTPAAHAHQLATTIPGAEHITLPGAGHMLPTRAARVVNDALTRVLHHATTSGKTRR